MATIDGRVTLASLGGLYRLVVGSDDVTGSIASLDTGLSTLVGVFTGIHHANQDATDAAYCTITHGSDGLVDVLCWTDAGVAAGAENTVYILAIGY